MASGSSGTRHAATIADVARRAGVSAGAVSYAMNDRPGVSEQTRRRVRQAAADLGWRPSGRAARNARPPQVGLVVAADRLLRDTGGLAPFLAGLCPALAAAGQALLLEVAADARTAGRTYHRLYRQQRVDALVVGAVTDPDPRLEALADADVPVVALTRPPCPGGALFLDADHAAGTRKAVRHLAALGHRRIGLVTGPTAVRHAAAQRAAWRAALAGAGLRPGPSAQDEDSDAGGHRATAALLPSAPTAVVYGSDRMALGGLAALHAAHVSVPAQVSVVGFGDLPPAAESWPALTTVAVDYRSWGRGCADLLAAALAGRPAPATPPVRVELVVRSSTAPYEPRR